MTDEHPNPFARAWRIADDVSGLDAPERQRALAAACGGDASLLLRVESILNFDDKNFLPTGGALRDNANALLEGAADLPDASAPGASIGDYQLLQELGVGGMSRVYLARREHVDFEHHVALKIMRSFGRHREESTRRFKREQQLLASLSHPNIASIIDGGVTPANRPYLVMEYVDGTTITDYCREAQIDLDARLSLFKDVCSAVEHAHRALVVHRDLKPSNIMVTRNGQVKLLDFGIAKILDDPDVEATRTGLLMMTPQYAAPEQVTSGRITTATDIYALGLILYELITDTRPWESEGASISEQIAQICEQAPPRPSTVAATRSGQGSQPARWSRRLRGDLDLIVGKALAKNPEERYGACGELVRDLHNWSTGLPVSAHAPAIGYRLRKFARRHWVGVSASGLFFGVVAAFLTALLVQQRATLAERDRAQMAEAANGAINRFLIDEMLGAASAQDASGRDVSVSQVLERAAETAGRAFDGQPALEASVRNTLGRTYLRLGELEKSAFNLNQAMAINLEQFDRDHPDRLRTGASMAELSLARGNLEAAGDAVRDVLAHQMRVLGNEHVDTLISQLLLAKVEALSDRWPDAESNLVATIALLATHHPQVWRPRSQALMELAKVYIAQRRPDEASAALNERLALQRSFLGENHPDMLVTMDVQSNVLRQMQRMDDALAVAERAYTLALKVYDEGHPETARMAATLGRSYVRARRYADAETMFRQAVRVTAARLGETHPDTISFVQNLAVTLSYQGGYEEAEALYKTAAEHYAQRHGERHSATIRVLKNLSSMLKEQKKFTEDRAITARLTDIARSFLDDAQADPILVSDMAEYLLECEPPELRDPKTALMMAQQAVERTQGQRGEPLMTLGMAQRANNDVAAAVATYERAATLSEMLHIHALPRELAKLYVQEQAIADGEAFFEAHLLRRQQARSPEDWLIGMTWHEFGRFYVNAGLGERAVPVLEKALTQYRLTRSPDDAVVLRSRAALGAAQMLTGNLDDGQRNLDVAYAGLLEDRQVTSDVKREILVWLIQLAQAKDDDAAVAKWQAELELRKREPLFSAWR
ncbi:MAG: tetratricopeptide repeat protein [Gammaproteobacteria bacterium]